MTTKASRESLQYEEFFGFTHSPFTLAPDPRFFYPSQSHQEAVHHLLHAIRHGEGIAILRGDLGTGKTTVCRTVLEQLEPRLFTSLILNPFLSPEELLREILLDFGVVSRETIRSGRISAAGREELLDALHDFLRSLLPIGGRGVLIVDEAQHLSADVLEQIHVLANLAVNGTTLLTAVLVGQLNLLDLLQQPEKQPLNLRISLRALLSPLMESEIGSYIEHRLSVATQGSTVAFTPGALDSLHSASGGVPRMINLVCDRALSIAAQSDTRVITRTMIDAAAMELTGRRPAGRWWWLPRWVAFNDGDDR